jgi:hypothetical protein
MRTAAEQARELQEAQQQQQQQQQQGRLPGVSSSSHSEQHQQPPVEQQAAASSLAGSADGSSSSSSCGGVDVFGPVCQADLLHSLGIQTRLEALAKVRRRRPNLLLLYMLVHNALVDPQTTATVQCTGSVILIAHSTSLLNAALVPQRLLLVAECFSRLHHPQLLLPAQGGLQGFCSTITRVCLSASSQCQVLLAVGSGCCSCPCNLCFNRAHKAFPAPRQLPAGSRPVYGVCQPVMCQSLLQRQCGELSLMTGVDVGMSILACLCCLCCLCCCPSAATAAAAAAADGPALLPPLTYAAPHERIIRQRPQPKLSHWYQGINGWLAPRLEAWEEATWRWQ